MNRYQFEIINYLMNNSHRFLIKEASDDLCISQSKIRDSINELLNLRYLKQEKTLCVTGLGMQELEKYRAKKAIILAAGFGSRMLPATENRPKPMVKVNGKRIIDSLLDSLVRVGINDITIVRGYKKEVMDELLEKYPFIKFVDNDDYDTTNNISSVMKILDELKGGCYLCEADLYISNENIIRRYHYSSDILGSYSLETDDWSYKMNDGYVSNYQKGNTFCYNYYGISYWSSEDCDKLREDFKEIYEREDGKDYFWEFIPFVLKKERYKVEIIPCRKQDIVEIDNYYELRELDSSYPEARTE